MWFVVAILPAVIVILVPVLRVMFGNPPHEYRPGLWFTSSDFIVSGLIILIAGNIELQLGRPRMIQGEQWIGWTSIVVACSGGLGMCGLGAYVCRYQAEEEAIRSKVDLVVDQTLWIGCPVIFLLMVAMGSIASALVLSSSALE